MMKNLINNIQSKIWTSRETSHSTILEFVFFLFN